MPNITIICYLFSLMSYGMGFSKVNLSLATGYFVLAIFLAVIGSLFYFVKNSRKPVIMKIITSNSKEKQSGNRRIEDVRAS